MSLLIEGAGVIILISGMVLIMLLLNDMGFWTPHCISVTIFRTGIEFLSP